MTEDKLATAIKELAYQNDEKEKRATELSIADKELAYQNDEKEKRATELSIANMELAFQNKEKEKRAAELSIADIELAYQNDEKEKRAAELTIANKELAFQNRVKEKRAEELIVANKELAYQNKEKEKRAIELSIANKELAYQNKEKEKRAAELVIANIELAYQNDEKEKRAAELSIANIELIFQNEEKEKRAVELTIANKELAYQNEEKEKRAAELSIANIELIFQNEEKAKRAAELTIANKELVYQNEDKEKRAAELTIANKELAYQNKEKEKRAAELILANKELAYQNQVKEKRATELILANKKGIELEELLRNNLKEITDYKYVLDESSIIAITDQNGIIKKVNNNFCLISKYSEEELIGQDHRIINSGYHSKEVIRNLWLTITSGKIWRGEIKNKAKDGTFYWVDTVIVPFLNEEGYPYQYLASRADITARKETEEYLIQRTAQLETANKELVSKNQLQNIFLNAPANICILEGPEQKYILANKAYEKLTNRKAEDLLGQNLREVFPELIGTGTIELFANVFETGEPFNAPEYAVVLDLNNEGVLRQYYFNFSLKPLRKDSGEIYAVMALSYDITAQVEARKIINENEKQQAFLLKLSDALRPLSNPVDIEEAVTQIAMDFMGADWCHYVTIEEDNLIFQRGASRDDFASLSGVYPISSFALFKDALNTGIPSIIDDVHTSDILDEDSKQLCVQLQNIAFVIVPIVKNGKPVGLLSLVQSKPRKWTDSEVQLTIETAERIWAAVERAKAAEALSKSEEKYRTLFTSIDQGFALCELIRNKEGKGIDYYMLEVNSAYEKQSGLNMEIILGKTILQAFPTLDKWWIETYAAVVDDQRPAIFEKYFEVTHRWFGVNAYPVSKEKFAVLFSDITERKLAEEKLKESDIIFKSIPDALISSDLTGRITSWNEGAEAIYGFSKEEMIGQIMPDVVPTEILNKEQENWQEIFVHQGHWKGEVIQTCKDGKKIYVSSAAHVIRNTHGENSGYVAVNRDITFQKEADIKIKESEKQLRELSTELEQKVQQRTIQLVEKNTELVNMNKELEAFAYVSGHDLQEPLRKIQVFIGRITDNEGQNFTEKGIDYFHRIREAANRMQTLIIDLLSFSRLNTYERKFEITDLNIIIDEVKAELRDTIQEKHATIENTALGSCNIIPFQFRQLMHNLIGNALKFSNLHVPSHIIIKSRVEKGNKLNNEKPALSPSRLSPEKNYCHITVKDNGIGFEPQYSERIFEVFQKLHRKEVYAGTGIGLAIVKKIVDNHNGIITATGELNKSATFDIYIPST